MAHEMYHALQAINPAYIKELCAAIRQCGFDIDLEEDDGELSATIDELVTIHLQGR